MKNLRKEDWKENGITLMTLVVTIIVLLILAGVAISLALNNNGVLDRAAYASNTWANATKSETLKMNELVTEIDELSWSKIKNNGIDYGPKTAETVQPGDTVMIGGECFRVLENNGITIIALPFYNITLDNDPVQSAYAGKVAFSSIDTPTWNTVGYSGNVDLAVHENNLQQYIVAYNNKIDRITNGKAYASYTVWGKQSADDKGIPIGKYQNEYVGDPSDEDYVLNTVGGSSYWVASWYGNGIGWGNPIDGSYEDYKNADSYGVRPAIVITI